MVDGDFGVGFGSQFDVAILESDLGANFLTEFGDKIGKGIKKIGDKIGDAGRQGFKKASKGFKTLNANIVASTMKLIAEGKAKFKWLTQKIANGIKLAWEKLKTLGKKLLSFLKKMIGEFWKAFLKLIVKIATMAGLVKNKSNLGGSFAGPFDNLKGKGQTTGKEIECAFKTHFEKDETKQEVIMTGFAGVAAGIFTGGAAAAAAAGASVARHGGAVVANAIKGKNCGDGEGGEGGEGGPGGIGGGGLPSGKVMLGIGAAAVVGMILMSKNTPKINEKNKTELKEIDTKNKTELKDIKDIKEIDTKKTGVKV